MGRGEGKRPELITNSKKCSFRKVVGKKKNHVPPARLPWSRGASSSSPLAAEAAIGEKKELSKSSFILASIFFSLRLTYIIFALSPFVFFLPTLVSS